MCCQYFIVLNNLQLENDSSTCCHRFQGLFKARNQVLQFGRDCDWLPCALTFACIFLMLCSEIILLTFCFSSDDHYIIASALPKFCMSSYYTIWRHTKARCDRITSARPETVHVWPLQPIWSRKRFLRIKCSSESHSLSRALSI